MVDLGPFKQKVDDGLPLRKAALAALSTILDAAPEHLDMAALAPPLAAALDDVPDVQQLCHQIVAKVAASPLHQSGVRASLDALAEPLRNVVDKTLKSIAKKLKEGTGGPELERQNDLVNPRENKTRAKQKARTAIQAEIRDISNNKKKKNDSAIARGFQTFCNQFDPPPLPPPPLPPRAASGLRARVCVRHVRCGPPSARSSRWTRPPTTTPPRPRPSSAP
jgi:hypothetical protein